MECRVAELRYKELIDIRDGTRYGCVGEGPGGLRTAASVRPAGPGGGRGDPVERGQALRGGHYPGGDRPGGQTRGAQRENGAQIFVLIEGKCLQSAK